MSFVGPGAIVRLDAALIDRVRRGDRPGTLIASALATIALGAGAYGIAFGIWRAPEQAIYSAIKLPLLFVAVAACTIVLSAMLAILLRARLGLVQSAVCITLSFAITSVLLGALAPIGIWIDLHAPPPDPIALGLEEADPRARATMAVAQGLLLVHVFALAAAGTAGVARLRSLLLALGLTRPIATRVLIAWIGLQFLVGSQLSWLLRPFFGRPHLPPSWTVPDVLEGNFYEEIEVISRATFGAYAPWVLALALVAIALTLVATLRERVVRVQARAESIGVALLPGDRVIPWSAIAAATARGPDLVLDLAPDAALIRERIVIACVAPRASRELARTIAQERAKRREGPFR